MTDRTLETAEFFAGIGLMRMGLEPHGWKTIFANDISKKKYDMYRGFYPDAEDHYMIDDVFNIPSSDVPDCILATCSFPCIDLSLAGNMNGFKGKHSSAFWGFIKYLTEKGESAPPFVLIENVPGWLYSNKGQDFRATVEALNNLNYTCDIFTINALSFTPQSRLRVFLIGTRCVGPEKNAKTLMFRSNRLTTQHLKQSVLSNMDLKWRHHEIPSPPPLKTKGLSEIVEMLDSNDKRWWDPEKTERHLNMMEKSHYKRIQSLIEGDTISYRTFFRRRRNGGQRAEVRHDEVAGCLRTAVGGSATQFLIQAGQGTVKMRAMTPREYARLQGVPDAFNINADGVQALTGFGDAVCVPVISWITTNVINPLVGKYLVAEQVSV